MKAQRYSSHGYPENFIKYFSATNEHNLVHTFGDHEYSKTSF
jgi:hypothetical protein